MSVATRIARGARLLCPSCGRAPLYRTFFEAHATCPSCGRRHERDRGDWVGGAEITLLLAALLAIAFVAALRAFVRLPRYAELAALMAAVVAGVPLLYRHVKGGWIGLVRHWEGDSPQPAPPHDPAWFADLWDGEAAGGVDDPPTLVLRRR